MPKRILTGKVTSNKSDKTITVLVERKIMHPMYKKFVTKSKKFAAHDIENKFKSFGVETVSCDGNSVEEFSKETSLKVLLFQHDLIQKKEQITY